MHADLRHGLAEYEFLCDRLKAESPEAEEETLRDTLEGLSNTDPGSHGRMLAMLRWGLMPWRAKDTKIGYSLIKAAA